MRAPSDIIAHAARTRLILFTSVSSRFYSALISLLGVPSTGAESLAAAASPQCTGHGKHDSKPSRENLSG
jgi:hypothetical protein